MRHLLTLEDWTLADLDDLCAQARALKLARGAGASVARPLRDKTVALLFEKPSLRTRVSFEVAARELGADTLYLAPQEVGLGSRESVGDCARVLSSYVHAIVLRTFAHATVEEFAHGAQVPVINGLTDHHHPCQGLTDIFTISEQFGSAACRTLAYCGDGNNVAHSLLQVAAKCGMHVRIAAPEGYMPDASIVAAACRDAEQSGGSVRLMSDAREAAAGADVLYTDVWTSMGQEAQSERRSGIFVPYRVDRHLLSLASPAAIVMHPLPAHRGQEITDEVIDGPQSRVFEQAANRLHVQKAILRTLLTAETRVSLTA
jgi:ornithine carbamoyltransferase